MISKIIGPLIGGLINGLSSAAGSIYLFFNGTDQYATHSPWAPTGVNFSVTLKYTPGSAAIGSLVTVLGDGALEKDASNNLVFSYTDTAAGAQSVTLSALTLVADTEYLIEVSSDGNGVSITVGADTALNAAVIDPDTLAIESWMGATNPSAGVIRDIDFVDGSAIQDGEFLQGDGSAIDVSMPTITSTNFSLLIPFVFDSGKTNQSLISSGSTTDFVRIDGPSNLAIRINSVQVGVSANFVDGQHYLLRLTKVGDEVTTHIDSSMVNTTVRAAWAGAVNFTRLFSLGASGQRYSGTAIIELTDTDTGNTYEYLLNNVTDSGTAPNTGNTEGSNVIDDNAWVLPAGVTNTEGVIEFTNLNAEFITQPFNFELGATYEVSLDAVITSGSGFRLPYDGDAANISTASSTGSYTHRFVATGAFNTIFMGFPSNATGQVSNMSLRKTYSGIVQNYDPLTDLVQIPNNTRRYPVSAASNIQPDVLNSDGVELFVPTSLDAGWTDNGDGSYSWDASSTVFIDCGTVLTVGKFVSIDFEVTERTGTGTVGLSTSGFSAGPSRRTINGVGRLTSVLEVTGTSLRLFFASGTGTGTVWNISVRETTSAEIINYDPSMVQ